MPFDIHIVRFLRSTTEPGTFRAVCTCGWSVEGDLEHVQTAAAAHDLDEAQGGDQDAVRYPVEA